MAIFEVYSNNDPDQARFVKDKGSVIALILPAVWLAWHRLWFALAVYLCIATFFVAIGNTPWGVIAGAFSFIPGLYLFLEGPGLIARKYLNNGYQLVDLIEADGYASAETKWFSKPVSWNIHNREISQVGGNQLATRPVIDRPDFGLFAEE